MLLQTLPLPKASTAQLPYKHNGSPKPRNRYDLSHLPKAYASTATILSLMRNWSDPSGRAPGRDMKRKPIGNLFSPFLCCVKIGELLHKERVLHHHFGIFETKPNDTVLFCRTLLERPDLALQTKRASLRHIAIPEVPTPGEPWIIDALNRLSHLLDLSGTTFNQDAMSWEQFLAPLVLVQLPNLKQLEVSEKGDLGRFKKFNKEAVIRGGAIFTSIRVLAVGSFAFDRPSQLMNFTAFLNVSKGSFGWVLPRFENLETLSL
ncbi:hypothetical protein F53441_7830 [Fusarium austroafricanum]|uniref:Uncharacterized protein n=1 Tax=Fusarium austroafricanum TaxID=2364996 RepID=A0A8H4KFB3_9HYPO|nr:hypothetical protein F53441_7830 [Fusarium austroafricanum]